MSCNGWKLLKNYRLNDDFCARNIEMRSASRKKTGSSQIRDSTILLRPAKSYELLFHFANIRIFFICKVTAGTKREKAGAFL